tara:strand:+ start:45 stop:347 length:303 start_codon:yes stop_codon:yes gene_type:complete
MNIPEDIQHKIWSMYFSNHVIKELTKRINKFLKCRDLNGSHISILYFEKPITELSWIALPREYNIRYHREIKKCEKYYFHENYNYMFVQYTLPLKSVIFT